MNFKGVEICCPHCQGDLATTGFEQDCLVCQTCQHSYPLIYGIPDLRVSPGPYLSLDQDRAKAKQLATRFDELDFAGLLAYYYQDKQDVPPQQIQQYTQGMLSAEAKAGAVLGSWESAKQTSNLNVLDIGCGTAPFLAAAASRYSQEVGVDIGLRWLVLGKKRLSQAGLDFPLICACAEALPFPKEQFQRVVLDSTLEHVQDQQQTLLECLRVMKAGAYLFISTPNRFSLGPDPHIGLWGGGYLPEAWVRAYVERKGGIPPKRQMLTAGALKRAVRQAGFSTPQIKLPKIANRQRDQFNPGIKAIIDLYNFLQNTPVSRDILLRIGPSLLAISQKPSSHMEPHTYWQPQPDLEGEISA
jgi:ubiquinone/menaquinone biosynthesis C-methylase UbiE